MGFGNNCGHFQNDLKLFEIRNLDRYRIDTQKIQIFDFFGNKNETKFPKIVAKPSVVGH